MDSPHSLPQDPQNSQGLSWQSIESEIDAELRALPATGESEAFQVDVQMLPKFGVYLRWPDNGSLDWVHPDDRHLAGQFIPGSRIFRCQLCNDPADQEAGYYQISYGEVAIRILPAMWLKVPNEGYEVGDRVEIKSDNGRNRPVIGDIREINYDPIARRTIYVIAVNQMPLARRFTRDDFRPCRRLGQPLDVRSLALLGQEAIGGL